MDEPKSLRKPEEQARRIRALHDPHIAPLTAFVLALRENKGWEYRIPYFDPLDGGIEAQYLFLLEAPGPKAVSSGFISRDNPDETAKNLFQLCQLAGIERRKSLIWNIVPWYIGSGSRIRPASKRDLHIAAPELHALLPLLPKLTTIVLLGRKAATMEQAISAILPKVRICTAPHPSPVFINRRPENRGLLLKKLQGVSFGLPGTG